MVAADHAARIAGKKLSAVVTDAQLLAEVLLHSYETYRYDLVMVFTDTMVEAEALGCKVVIPEDDNPYLAGSIGPAAGNLVPADPDTAGRMPVVLGATRIIVRALGKQVPVLTSLKGPFSLAAFLLGVEDFLMRMRGDPDTGHALLRFALRNQQRYAEAIVAAGGIPFIGDPLATGDIISRQDFRDFALPYLRELTSQIQTRARPVGLHVCGDTSDRLPLLRDTGADILSLDEVNFGFARRALGNEVILMGNVPTQLIHQGTAEVVKDAARKCLADAGPRMILSSACDVPRDAPIENVRAIVEAGHEVR